MLNRFEICLTNNTKLTSMMDGDVMSETASPLKVGPRIHSPHSLHHYTSHIITHHDMITITVSSHNCIFSSIQCNQCHVPVFWNSRNSPRGERSLVQYVPIAVGVTAL